MFDIYLLSWVLSYLVLEMVWYIKFRESLIADIFDMSSFFISFVFLFFPQIALIAFFWDLLINIVANIKWVKIKTFLLIDVYPIFERLIKKLKCLK